MLKAACAKVNITPRHPVPLQGYDPESNVADPETDLLDDLYARIVLLDDGAASGLFISVDCCLANEQAVHVPNPNGRPGGKRVFVSSFPEGAKTRWAKAAGIGPESVSVHATHTHTAPATLGQEQVEAISAEINRLPGRLVPVQLSAAHGSSGISAYRRPTLRADLSVPVNQKMQILWLETEEGEPLCAMVNYAVHPTALRNPTNRISGDIVGLGMTELEQHFGPKFVGVFLQGFSGDICPRFGDNGPAEDTYPAVQEGARTWFRDILSTLERKKPVEAGAIKAIIEEIRLPTRDGYDLGSLTVVLKVISIGSELLFVSLSGEIFNGFIERIERIAPAPFVFTCGVANGYSGYIPDLAAFLDRKGGYEMNTTPYTSNAEGILLERVREAIYKLTPKS